MNGEEMHELYGDLWREHAGGAVVAITTSGMLTRAGAAVLLRGCAMQARQRFPGLPKVLGALIRQHGNHVYDLGRRIVSFPIEEDPFQIADPRLIERSCRELVDLADYKNWTKIVVPRPGCGGGGLAWSEVRSVLARHFDGRFYVITDKEDQDETC